MPLLAQCGYGRGEKINLGLNVGSISGVILSPRDETGTSLTPKMLLDALKNVPR